MEIINIEKGLRLRPFDGKFDFALPWYQNEETVRLVDGVAGVYTPEKLARMYNGLAKLGEEYFIEVEENGKWKPIGDVTFWKEDMPIVIGDVEYRRKGIGRKVISALADRGSELGYERIFVQEVYHFNIASQKCFESAGFKRYKETETGISYVLELKQVEENDV